MAGKALQKFDNQLEKIFAPQIDLVRRQYEATLPQFQAQEASLEQAKVNAFRDIGDIANRRGVFFGGFQPNEQARYVGEKFLPEMAKVQQGRQQANLSMLEAITGFNTQKATARLDFRETLRKEAVQRALAKKDFQRQMKLQKQSQKFQSRESAKDRALSMATASMGGGGGSLSQWENTAQEISYVSEAMEKHRGRKSKGAKGKHVGVVSPKVWNKLKSQWTKRGGKASVFEKEFAGYLPRGRDRKKLKSYR